MNNSQKLHFDVNIRHVGHVLCRKRPSRRVCAGMFCLPKFLSYIVTLNSKQSVSSIVFRVYCIVILLAIGVISVRRKPALLPNRMFTRLDY